MAAPVKVVWHRPPLYQKQYDAIYSPKRYAFIEASTKAGKTMGCMVWLFEQALHGKPGDQFWWVAPTRKQARIAFRRYRRGLRKVGGNATLDLFTPNNSELTIQLFNDTTLSFLTGEDPDNLYGDDVRAAVMDEASRAREESWHAIRSTLTATRGPLRAIGNVKGRGNWFYAMCRRAEAGDPGMHYAMLTADDAVRGGVIDADEIDDARRMLPEAIFRELYYCEPGDDQGNPFGIKSIRACVAPMSTAEPWVWGWDLAKKHDYTVGIALDRAGNVCRFERFQMPWQETIAAIRRHVGHLWAFVDSTGVGDPVLEALQRRGGSNFAGFQFTSPSKQQLMEGLAVAIQSGLIAYPDGTIVKELESFEYEYTRTGVRYQAPEGFFDDCVCALALAWHGFRQRPQEVIPMKEAVIVSSTLRAPGADIPMDSDDAY